MVTPGGSVKPGGSAAVWHGGSVGVGAPDGRGVRLAPPLGDGMPEGDAVGDGLGDGVGQGFEPMTFHEYRP